MGDKHKNMPVRQEFTVLNFCCLGSQAEKDKRQVTGRCLFKGGALFQILAQKRSAYSRENCYVFKGFEEFEYQDAT